MFSADHDVWIDFESKALVVDLKADGTIRYAADASTSGSFAMVYITDAIASQTVDVQYDPVAHQMLQNIQNGLVTLFGGSSSQPNVKAFLLSVRPDGSADKIEVSATNSAAAVTANGFPGIRRGPKGPHPRPDVALRPERRSH